MRENSHRPSGTDGGRGIDAIWIEFMLIGRRTRLAVLLGPTVVMMRVLFFQTSIFSTASSLSRMNAGKFTAGPGDTLAPQM